MSTHHTLIASTNNALSPEIWTDIFEQAGGSMRLGWSDFKPSEVLETSANKRALFFWTSSGELDSWAERVLELLKQYDPDASVEYFFDVSGEIHGFWHNGTLRVEAYSDFYEVVQAEYNPLSNLIHNPDKQFFTVVYNGEVLLLSYDVTERVHSHNSEFSELKTGTLFRCQTPEGRAVWVIQYEGQYYSEDIEHGML